ncbi:MAG: hypothetical protein ABSA27_13445, partial [Terriglobales bacterium]
MALYEVNPLKDPRWNDLLERDARASVFHTAGWLDALRRSYGYVPTVLTTCRPTQELTNGIVFCRVNSWLTGERMVSLPFSDHCEPIMDDLEGLGEIVYWLSGEVEKKKVKYVEVRPLKLSMKEQG